MDIEKLIERLNTKLQSYALYTDSEFARAMEDAITAIETLRADLARVTAERDAAVERIREWEKFDTYLFVHNFITPEKWRGPGKED